MTRKDQERLKLDLAAMVEGRNHLNGSKCWTRRDAGVTFVELPKALWRSAGLCVCDVCKGKEGFWDTLAVPPSGHAYTVHHPNGWVNESYQGRV